MKRNFIMADLLAVSASLFAQEAGFTFTVVKENPITSTKNQIRCQAVRCSELRLLVRL